MDGQSNSKAAFLPKRSTMLDEAIELAKRGERQAAQEQLRGLVQREPDNEEAWLWLAWVVKDPEESRRILREAQTLLPDSERIAHALAWAKQQDSPSASESPQSDSTPQPRSRKTTSSGIERSASKVDEVARGAEARWSQLTDAVKDVAVNIPFERVRDVLRGVTPTAFSVLGILLIGLLVTLGVLRARRNVPVVQALELPTPVLDATPTPSPEQLAKPIWVDVEVAWTRQDWDKVISSLERIRAISPRDDEARKRLAEAYYYRGLEALQANEMEQARLDLDAAIRLDASSRELQRTRRELERYRQACELYLEQDWGNALVLLEQVYARNPDFRDVRPMLAEASLRRGEELEAQELWEEAKLLYLRANELLPEWDEPEQKLAHVEDLIHPPRRIEVDLSDYLVTVYENHEPIKVFPACVGRPSAPTRTGRFKVQTKLDNAYASKWDLDMPYWVGIYDAGGSENGFHALPILSNGQVLWRGALGTGCSYGCIVLDTPDAKWLYQWARLGDPVIITR